MIGLPKTKSKVFKNFHLGGLMGQKMAIKHIFCYVRVKFKASQQKLKIERAYFLPLVASQICWVLNKIKKILIRPFLAFI